MASMAFEIDGTALYTYIATRINTAADELSGEAVQSMSTHSPNDFWREQHQPRPQLFNVHVQIAQHAAV